MLNVLNTHKVLRSLASIDSSLKRIADVVGGVNLTENKINDLIATVQEGEDEVLHNVNLTTKQLRTLLEEEMSATADILLDTPK